MAQALYTLSIFGPALATALVLCILLGFGAGLLIARGRIQRLVLWAFSTVFFWSLFWLIASHKTERKVSLLEDPRTRVTVSDHHLHLTGPPTTDSTRVAAGRPVVYAVPSEERKIPLRRLPALEWSFHLFGRNLLGDRLDASLK